MNIISTSQAPAAIGPYSQAVSANGMLFVSGQIPLDAETMSIVGDNIQTQTQQVFANIKAILSEAGCSLSDVVRCDVFVANMADFSDLNTIYANEFGNHKPARQTIQAILPKSALVEISCIAIIP